MRPRAIVWAGLMAGLAVPAVHAQVSSGTSRVGPRVVPPRNLDEEARRRAPLPFISDVRIVPGASTAVISFRSSQRTPPLVEVGRAPAVADRFGVMAFPAGTSAFTRFVQPRDGRYTLDLDVSREQLDAGTTYYYIINVFNDDRADRRRPREQDTGEFSTLTQSVTVVWDRIVVLNDSDDDSAGEISIWGWVNHGSPEQCAFSVEELGDDSASDGQSFAIGRACTIANAPNDLALAVSGIEDDTGPFSRLAHGTGAGAPLDGPAHTDSADLNVARDVIDLTRFPSAPGETRSQPFTLTSMPGGRLAFEIYGHFEITRKAG